MVIVAAGNSWRRGIALTAVLLLGLAAPIAMTVGRFKLAASYNIPQQPQIIPLNPAATVSKGVSRLHASIVGYGKGGETQPWLEPATTAVELHNDAETTAVAQSAETAASDSVSTTADVSHSSATADVAAESQDRLHLRTRLRLWNWHLPNKRQRWPLLQQTAHRLSLSQPAG